jgi:hypothetical protein
VVAVTVVDGHVLDARTEAVGEWDRGRLAPGRLEPRFLVGSRSPPEP